jgi:hypothetical protein
MAVNETLAGAPTIRSWSQGYLGKAIAPSEVSVL